jgi:hypothetical protein
MHVNRTGSAASPQMDPVLTGAYVPAYIASRCIARTKLKAASSRQLVSSCRAQSATMRVAFPTWSSRSSAPGRASTPLAQATACTSSTRSFPAPLFFSAVLITVDNARQVWIRAFYRDSSGQ